MDVKVTPGGKGDSPQAKPLLMGAKTRHPEIRIDSSSMDSAYDAYGNYRFAIEDIGTAPIIALNPRGSKDKKRGRLKFRCPAALGRCQCLFHSSYSLSPYGKTFYLHPERDYRLIGPIPRGSNIWQEKYNARTSVERAYSEEKGSHHLANPRVRGLARVKIHVYLALSAQVIKRIGATIIESLSKPHPIPCPVKT